MSIDHVPSSLKTVIFGWLLIYILLLILMLLQSIAGTIDAASIVTKKRKGGRVNNPPWVQREMKNDRTAKHIATRHKSNVNKSSVTMQIGRGLHSKGGKKQDSRRRNAATSL
jgi:hypothetical protein